MTRSRIPVGRIVAAIVLTVVVLQVVGGGASILSGLLFLPLLILRVAVTVLLIRWLLRMVFRGPRRRRHPSGWSEAGGSHRSNVCRPGHVQRTDRWQQWSQEPGPRPMSPEEAEWEGFLAEARTEVDAADHPQ